MIKKEYIKLFNGGKDHFNSIAIDQTIEDELQKVIRDKEYFQFIREISNGGFFFSECIHMYRLCSGMNFNDIKYVNNEISKSYGELTDGLFSFGQEIFGNQFAFEIESGSIIYFIIETGERQKIADNFSRWLDELFSNFEFLTGVPYKKQWEKENSINLGQRLQPKIPFVIGGDYIVSNFYAVNFPKYIHYNADIAKQVVNLKDGEKVRLNIMYPQ